MSKFWPEIWWDVPNTPFCEFGGVGGFRLAKKSLNLKISRIPRFLPPWAPPQSEC